MSDTPDALLVRSTIVDGIATITLDSPHNRNALSARLITELRDATAAAIAAAPRAIVLTHSGPTFCAGADLKEAAARRVDGTQADSSPMIETMGMLADADAPTIAAVRGPVRAGGIGLMAACDLVVVADDVTFALTEVRIGVAPAIISVPILRRVNPSHIAAAMLTGEPFSAADARAMGLITHVAPADDVDATVEQLCDGVRAGAPGAVAATKDLLWRVPDMEREAALAEMQQLSADLFASDEAAEGVQSFLEKRRPAWATK